MFVNLPFVPETQDTVDRWHSRLRGGLAYSDEKIAALNIDVNYHITENLTPEYLGFDDNTGFYPCRLSHSYNQASLSDGYEILSYFEFLPVVLTERMLEQDYEEPVFLEGGRYSDSHEVYSVKSEIMHKTYGFVLNIEHFMSLIGEQLRASKRQFAVSFHKRDYHENIFDKNGRLHHPDHEKVKLTEKDTLISFHIFELVDTKSYQLPQEDKLAFMCAMFQTENAEDAKAMNEQVHNEAFINSLNLERNT
jgi:hypothetical protein